MSLYINVEKNILRGFDALYYDKRYSVSTISRNITITPAVGSTVYALQRKISEDEMEDVKMDLMPGFRLKWNYSEEVKLDRGDITITYSTVYFRRF